jgi:hypothetical protein
MKCTNYRNSDSLQSLWQDDGISSKKKLRKKSFELEYEHTKQMIARLKLVNKKWLGVLVIRSEIADTIGPNQQNQFLMQCHQNTIPVKYDDRYS